MSGELWMFFLCTGEPQRNPLCMPYSHLATAHDDTIFNIIFTNMSN